MSSLLGILYFLVPISQKENLRIDNIEDDQKFDDVQTEPIKFSFFARITLEDLVIRY
uniref:Uncharacterized protein n=1 Tax=Romanomermis culicivorax TaxID=13658 RepID=A0A915I7P0_ROMCU